MKPRISGVVSNFVEMRMLDQLVTVVGALMQNVVESLEELIDDNAQVSALH